ncbi:MAG: tripartite tricarboxylate transporter substrate binding protein [Acetobacteraceae bacterium]|nr:tripartite tricarboxylate transporter substrate binding protein [Acetobacteraceae bacterium]
MRRAAIGFLAVLIGALAGPLPARAAWPDRPVTLIVPFGAGSSPDISARVVAERLSAAWRQPVVVQNIPGASATIGVDRVAKSAPDGYTLGYTGDGAMVVRISMDPPIPYDPRRDIAPITLLARTRNVLAVHPAVPATTLAELVALARARPGQIAYAHSGVGFSVHLGVEMLKQAAAIDLTAIPYANEGQMFSDAVQGRVQVILGGAGVVQRVQAGQLRPLAVSSRDRLPLLPAVPTIAESGYPGFEAVAWFGLIAPARTPRPILDRIHADAAALLADPATRAKLEEFGLAIAGDGPDAFAAMIPREIERMQGVLQPLGLRAR